MPPAFLYFDLGNVLLHFDHRRACRQMGDVAGVDAEAIWKFLFEEEVYFRSETGEWGPQAVYDAFCSRFDVRPDFAALEEAGSAIFELNAPMVPLVTQLAAAGWRMGVLSNTSESHWSYAWRRFHAFAGSFPVLALSYQLGSMKPASDIYRRAAELAGAAPEQIFFTDDRAENVAGAKAAGYDAVLFTGPTDLMRELRQRGVGANY